MTFSSDFSKILRSSSRNLKATRNTFRGYRVRFYTFFPKTFLEAVVINRIPITKSIKLRFRF